MVYLVLDGVLKFEIDLAHTIFIAALVVDQNISIGAFLTDITIDIFFTSKDVDITESLVKMVVISTCETKIFVLGWSEAGRQVNLGLGNLC